MFIKTVLTKDKSDYESEVDGLTDWPTDRQLQSDSDSDCQPVNL
jgi:hypothetical protein